VLPETQSIGDMETKTAGLLRQHQHPYRNGSSLSQFASPSRVRLLQPCGQGSAPRSIHHQTPDSGSKNDLGLSRPPRFSDFSFLFEALLSFFWYIWRRVIGSMAWRRDGCMIPHRLLIA
jgi:hypothetical protein